MVAVDWILRRGFNRSNEVYLNGPWRRGLDVFVAFGLLVALAPVMLGIAVGTLLTSRGPIFFRQLRTGRDMRTFELLKFRSMRCDGPDDGMVQQATRDDPRVTRFGRFLRASSLDELPQLINVIKGEMSMVGPRPHAIEHDEYYAELIPNYQSRFRARPGLTGLAQVNGARGGTPQLEDMQRRVDLDITYLENATLKLDCLIFVQTFREVFGSRSAY